MTSDAIPRLPCLSSYALFCLHSSVSEGYEGPLFLSILHRTPKRSFRLMVLASLRQVQPKQPPVGQSLCCSPCQMENGFKQLPNIGDDHLLENSNASLAFRMLADMGEHHIGHTFLLPSCTITSRIRYIVVLQISGVAAGRL